MIITYYIVRNVLLLGNGAANVQLEQCEFYVEGSDPDGADDMMCRHDHPDAQLLELGGKHTEVRHESDPGYRPGDVLMIETTKLDWSPPR